MACSHCRQAGHNRPRCPAILEFKREQKQFLQRVLIESAPALLANPLIVAVLWYYYSRNNPTATQLNLAIVGAEFIPALDLGLPPGVVLGAMVDKSEDAAKAFNQAKDFIFNLPIPDIPTKEEIKEAFKEEAEKRAGFLEEFFKDIPLDSFFGVGGFGAAV